MSLLLVRTTNFICFYYGHVSSSLDERASMELKRKKNTGSQKLFCEEEHTLTIMAEAEQ